MNKIEQCYIDLGLIFQRKRIRLGLTQEKFAKQFKINRVSLAKLETGKGRIMFHDVIKIAKKAKINLNGLLK